MMAIDSIDLKKHFNTERESVANAHISNDNEIIITQLPSSLLFKKYHQSLNKNPESLMNGEELKLDDEYADSHL